MRWLVWPALVLASAAALVSNLGGQPMFALGINLSPVVELNQMLWAIPTGLGGGLLGGGFAWLLVRATALFTPIARRRPGVDGPIERVVTVKARGRLGDGRWLWSGDELTWGAISIVDARALGWDLEHTSSIRATVRSEGGTHRILVRHHLSAVTVAAG